MINGEKLMAKQDPIKEDIVKMLEAIQKDRAYGPFQMYIPDESLIVMGYDPNIYPELEGYPGIRIIESRWKP